MRRRAVFPVAAVLTQPDRPQGRKRILTPSPVKQAAEELGIPVLQPARLKEALSSVRAVGADVLVTCAYGQILTQEALDLFPLGVWNVHASLLPKFRGAAPVSAAILAGGAGDGRHHHAHRRRAGYGRYVLKARPSRRGGGHLRLAHRKALPARAELLTEALLRIERGEVSLTPQGEGTLCRKTVRTQIDFSRPAREVSALIRALSPAPLAFAAMGELVLNCYNARVLPADKGRAGEVLCASPREGLIVRCGEGAVRIFDVQPAGGKRMTDAAFCNGGKGERGGRVC